LSIASLIASIMRLRRPREVHDPAMETGLVCAHRQSSQWRLRAADFSFARAFFTTAPRLQQG
jgi:hypothetical protein